MEIIERNTISEAWEAAFNLIMQKGSKITDEEQELLEIFQLFLVIKSPDSNDPIAEKQDESMKMWMRENFTQIKEVKELKNSWSYGWRLFQYQGINQIEWVIQSLKKKPETKSATITMLQGAGMEDYVPCVSLLDFKIRGDKLWLSATCRSLDFGTKAIYNMSNLAAIARNVANEVNIEKIGLFMHVISAHIYNKQWK